MFNLFFPLKLINWFENIDQDKLNVSLFLTNFWLLLVHFHLESKYNKDTTY